jgi:hypothetical protein
MVSIRKLFPKFLDLMKMEKVNKVFLEKFEELSVFEEFERSSRINF